jgi:hypothetical protein
MRFWLAARTWFQGKKMYLGGGGLIVLGVAGAFLGRLSVTDALGAAMLGLSICGQAAKANRHQSQILAALTAAATAGADLRMGNRAGALEALQPVVREAIQAATAPALSVTVSGSDAAAVRQAATDLAMQPGPPRIVSAAEMQALVARTAGTLNRTSLVAVPNDGLEVKS